MPTVPAGFTVSVYAELPSPRMMVYAPNGDLFVTSPATNTITVLRDANNDGVFEARGVYASAAGAGGGAAAPRGTGGPAGGAPGGGRGAGAAGGPPAGAPGGGAGRGAGPGGPGGGGAAGGRGAGGPGGGAPAAPAAPVAPGTPNPAINGPILGAAAPACTAPPAFVPGPAGPLTQPFGMAFNNGYLYVGNTNSIVRYKYTSGDMVPQGEPEKIVDLPGGGNHFTRNIVFNRAGTKMYVSVGSATNNDAGSDCRRAAVLEFNPDGSGMRIFASGIRNPVGLALQPGTDIVWTAINERDNLGDDLVPDYATSVKDGGFYGWPYSYIGKNYDPRYVGAFP
jgi:glucose/arabinose dehydrogenase